MFKDLDRRRVLTALGTAALLPVAGIGSAAEQDEGEVEALEDLMREHGVLRRALLVYAEAATRLAGGRVAKFQRALYETPRRCSAASARIITSAPWKRNMCFLR